MESELILNWKKAEEGTEGAELPEEEMDGNILCEKLENAEAGTIYAFQLWY